MNDERPIVNRYWVIPGEFLAGEYPGSRGASAAKAKLKALLEAGVSCFVDRTEADEGLAAYHHLLSAPGGSKAAALRFPFILKG
jgi:hypothetical protein